MFSGSGGGGGDGGDIIFGLIKCFKEINPELNLFSNSRNMLKDWVSCASMAVRLPLSMFKARLS